MDLAKTLSYNYIFRGVPAGAVATLAALADRRKFSGGDVLLRQFDSSQDVLILLSGEAVTRTFNGDTVARFGPGSVIGEMALVDGQARSATVTAAGPCEVAVLPAEVIRALMEMDADVAGAIYANLAKVLSRRLRNMNSQADSMRVAGAA